MGAKNTIRLWNAAEENDQRVSIGLHALREATNFDVGNIAANGGVLASDSTPILEAINAATDGCQQVNWVAGNSDQVIFQIAIPADISPVNDLKIKFRAKSGGVTDTPALTATSFFDEADTAVVDVSEEITASYAEHTITIAAEDIPAGARTLTVGLVPGTHAADTFLLTALWLEYNSTYKLPK